MGGSVYKKEYEKIFMYIVVFVLPTRIYRRKDNSLS